MNLPEPITVDEDACGFPVAVRVCRRGTGTARTAVARKLEVASVEDTWRIDDEWWREGPVSRLYYAVLCPAGQRLVIYKDLESGKWYRQGY